MSSKPYRLLTTGSSQRRRNSDSELYNRAESVNYYLGRSSSCAKKCRLLYGCVCDRVAPIFRLTLLLLLILFLYWNFRSDDSSTSRDVVEKSLSGRGQYVADLAARPFKFLLNNQEMDDSKDVKMEEPEPSRFVSRTGGEGVMRKRIFHLDMKGAPPKPEIFHHLFPLLHKLNFTGVLMEYEDMFPYNGNLQALSCPYAYDPVIIQSIQNLATMNNLEIIPLIQTFGHLEFALKHNAFSALREVANLTDTICPSEPKSFDLIKDMLTQVWLLHPNSRYIHIGADEAWHIAQDERCHFKLQHEFRNSTDRLKLDHISRIAHFAKTTLKFEAVWAWNDMFDKIDVDLLKEYKLGELIVPVVWGYVEDVTKSGYFPDGMFQRYRQVFDEILLAGAFKGANGIAQSLMNTTHYMANIVSYHNLFNQMRPLLVDSMSGMVLTGWQRYSHDRPLCELLPVGIPCLVQEAFYLSKWNDHPDPSDMRFMDFLQYHPPTGQDPMKPVEYHGELYRPPFETMFTFCDFLGADLFKEIESLRFIKWKAVVDGHVTEALRMELKELAKRVKPILLNYFYEETVNEWMLQNMDPSQLIHGPSAS
ncbi:glycosyl hydrolase family 20, catalytic domain-containing protein [Ditylenchus destructor]|nr:glycosyl hydrolase family 20, catalytic domain-containing protein [Ditylenchus destructor]